MLSLGALVLAAALAPRAEAQSPAPAEIKPLPPVDDHAPPGLVEASSTPDPYRDAGLRPVSFEAKTVHASTRRVISPDLRDPFRMAKRNDANKKAKPLQLHGDLRDPFARHRDKPTAEPPADLRQPFRGPCPTQTENGVKIQRPKSLKRPGCETARADRGSRLARR